MNTNKITKAVVIGLMGIGVMGLFAKTSQAATVDTAIVDVLVTPIVSVSLTASPTFYNFGIIALNSSEVSATAVTLTNGGDIGISLQKHANNSESGDWSLGASIGSNQFSLHTAVNATLPLVGDFTGSTYISGLTDDDLLNIGSASQVTMNPAANVNVWFKLDMPNATTTGAQQRIPVHFVGTAQ